MIFYTSITGGKDEPRDDVENYTYDKFKDPRMNAKFAKVCPHMFLPKHEWSCWVDGNLTPDKKKLEELVKTMEFNVAVGLHPERDNIYDEAQECKRLGLDDPKIIDEQIEKYGGTATKHVGLAACYIIIRKDTPNNQKFNNRWWAEICRHSVRDQISFPYVFRQWDIIPKDCFTRKPHKIPR